METFEYVEYNELTNREETHIIEVTLNYPQLGIAHKVLQNNQLQSINFLFISTDQVNNLLAAIKGEIK